MNDQDREAKITEVLATQDLYRCKSVDNINHNPHPYMIGPKHVVYASDNHSGRLGEDAILAGEKAGKCNCAHPGCNIPYESHSKGNKVAFLQLLRNGTNDEASKVLKDLVDQLGENFVEGFVFVDTDEKFRIN